MEPSSSGSALQQQGNEDEEVYAQTVANLTLLDPARWGWSAVGGVVDLLPPHERARRPSAQQAHLKQIKRKERLEARKKKDEASRSTSVVGGASVVIGAAQNAPLQLGEGKMSAMMSLAASNFDPGGPSIPEKAMNVPQNSTLAAFRQGVVQTANGQSLNQNTAATGVARGTMQLSMQSSGVLQTANGQSLNQNAAATGVVRGAMPLSMQSSSVVSADTQGRDPPQANLAPQQSTAADPIMARLTAHETIHVSESSKGRLITPRALTEAGVLDIYTYHRGREGFEPRDEGTGQLLCDAEATDTNHGWEPPNLNISINISFPLSCDADEACSNDESKLQDDQAPFEYRDTIEWDLADPKSPSPLVFATGIGEEFGLDSCHTLELAESIQRQINDFVQTKITYKIPIATKDAHGNERTPVRRGPPQLYGSIVGGTKPGMTIPPEERTVKQSSTEKSPAIVNHERRVMNGVNTNRKNSVPVDVEPMYSNEVLRRVREASIKDVQEKWLQANTGEEVGALKLERDCVCHVCHSRKSRCRLFPCNFSLHALCDNHVELLVGISLENDEDQAAVDFCPICALACDCKRCTNKLAKVSKRFKNQCIEQDKSPGDVSFDNLLQLCRSKAAEKSKDRRLSNDSVARVSRKTVPKVPAADFPREIAAGRDLDPGTLDDYRTVYSAQGTFIRNDLPGAREATSSEGTVEDGNIDYCFACLQAGNLLCCDVCPRAFHPRCITSDKPSQGDWECVVCQKEKEISEDDVVTGDSSLDFVSAPFADAKFSTGHDNTVRVLSMIHETIVKLMKYDFGWLFRKPVSGVQGYSEIVKEPMDLGTINANLTCGKYAKEFSKNADWDDVLVAVLRDIELVWHNCFTFNCEGSSIYRMAEVQRQKYEKVRKKSFDRLLSEQVKLRLGAYILKCEEERKTMAANVATHTALLSSTERRPSIISGRNKIAVRQGVGAKGRFIAVLDPESGLIVKIYTMLKAACLAAQLLAGLGHRCEVPEITEATMRSTAHKGAQDPELLLFGYRWLYMDELAGSKVKFRKPAPVLLPEEPNYFVEMRNGGGYACMFQTVEEAVSHPQLSEDISIAEARRILRDVPAGETKDVGGISWKMIHRERRIEDTGKSQASATDGICCSAGFVHGSQKFVLKDVPSEKFPSSRFVKVDRISRNELVGFDSATSAHFDWIGALNVSPVVVSPPEPTDLEYFLTHYVDQGRSVDGMIWKRKEKAPEQPNSHESISTNAPPSEEPSNATTLHQSQNVRGPFDHESDKEQESMNKQNLNRSVDVSSPPRDKTNGSGLQLFSPLLTNSVAKTKLVVVGDKRNRDNEHVAVPPSKKAATCS